MINDRFTSEPDEAGPPGGGGSGAFRHYRLFGLTIASEVELPELAPAPERVAADVTIVRGKVEEEGEGPRILGLRAFGKAGIVQSPGGRFRIENGNSITVDAGTETPERNTRLFLLGSAMGALLHQRGILPLHANAIEIGGRAVAFAGRSGSGKSTLAAAFHDRGYRLLCDDVCAITRGPDGFAAQPGIPRVRLWRDAVERSGRTADSLDQAFEGADKYVVPIRAGHADSSLPLAAIFILAEPEGPQLELRPLPAAPGVRQIVANTYRGRYIPLVGDQRRHFETCLALALAVPLFELHRPWDDGRLDETVDLIETYLSRA